MKRNKFIHTFTYFIVVFLLTGCDMFDYHPYQGRLIGPTGLTDVNLQKIERAHVGKNFCFAFISDTQRWYDDTNDAVSHINQSSGIDFIIHGGDLTDFGVTEEFEWMRDCLQGLQKPWLTVIGNHDFLGNGEHIYEEVFGKFNYAFTVGHVRFEMLNTVALELDYSTPVPDFEFLENEIHYIDGVNAQYPDSLTRTVFVMHSRPGDEQFNNNVLLPFDRYLQLFPQPICFNGHNHATEVLEPFGDGILFYGICNIHKRQYYLVNINEDNSYDVKTIVF